MILSDKTIKTLIKSGTLSVTPLEEEQIQPASIDIRISTSFLVPKFPSGGVVLLDTPIEYETFTTDEYIIEPKQFVLATTMEYFTMDDNLTAFVEGRSSIGRLGLFIQNAGWVDPGFEGEITLELFNASEQRISLKKGQRVGQMVFAQLDRDADNPYRGKYHGQRGATGSRVYLDHITEK